MTTGLSDNDIIVMILERLSGSSSTMLAEVATSVTGMKVVYDHGTETFTIKD